MVKLQLGEILKRGLTSTRAISVLGVAIWLPLGAMRIVYRFLMLEKPIISMGFVASVLVLCLVSIVACLLISQTLLRNQNGYRSTAGRTFAAYFLLLLMAGLGQALVDNKFDTGLSFSVIRVFSGFFGLYLIACILDTFDRYQDDLVRLRSEQDKLNRIRQASANDLSRMRSRVVSELNAKLATPWHEIRQHLVKLSNSGANTSDLRSLSDEIRGSLIVPVRTLSYEIPQTGFIQVHSLDDESRAIDANQAQNEHKPAIDWHAVRASIPTTYPFYPLFVSLALSILSLSNIEILDPVGTLVSSVIFFVVGFLLFSAAKKFVAPWLTRQNTLVAWIVWTLVVVGISMTTATAAAIGYSGFGFAVPALVPLGGFLVANVAMMLSFFGTIYTNAQTTRDSVQVAVELTRREAVALRQELESTGNQIAHILHGEVQSMLTSAAFRLDLAAECVDEIDGDQQTMVAIGEVQAMLDEASHTIDSIAAGSANDGSSVEQFGVRERVDDVCESWTGIVAIESRIDSATAARLDARVNEASLAPVVTDIVREAILNAVRHGGADLIQVQIAGEGSVCHITVANDGRSPATPITTGLGFASLDRLDCQWSLEPGSSDGATLTIALPFLDEARIDH